MATYLPLSRFTLDDLVDRIILAGPGVIWGRCRHLTKVPHLLQQLSPILFVNLLPVSTSYDGEVVIEMIREVMNVEERYGGLAQPIYREWV